jgi:hypothetical protein
MGFVFILIYLGIIFAVIEISTALFIFTGLERKVARFQAISMLTGTGFTTGESELIIDHPIRRKLGAFLILFGAFSLAVIISAITNLLTESFYTMEIAYIAGGMFALLFILKLPRMQKILTEKLKSELKEHYELGDLPITDVLLLDEDDVVRDISIGENSPFTGKKFNEIIQNEEDIMLLFIKRGDLNIRSKAPNTTIKQGDRIIVYGNNPLISEKFKENGA